MASSTNFSRPRRPSEGQTGHRAINTLSVVSERDEILSPEPRCSLDSDRHTSRNHFADGHGHGSTTRALQLGVRDQRYPSNGNVSKTSIQIPASLKRDGYCNPTMPVPPDVPRPDITRRNSERSSTPALQLSRKNSASASTRTSSTRPPPSSRSNSTSTTASTKQPFVPKSILKVTTVEQTSERSYSRSDSTAGSSSKSSDSGSIPVSYDNEGKFVASDYDTSELSEKEIKKLQKKGINPALALEMKALRKGKSFGNLVGNAYVS